MKNTTGADPHDTLIGRLRFTVSFVDQEDIDGKRLLNVGCGFGWFEANALERGCGAIFAMEIEDANLTTLLASVSDPRLQALTGDACRLPFADDSFDTISAYDVLEHLPRASEPVFFREIARVLRPGGRIYISVPRRSFFSNVFDPAWWLIGHRHYSLSTIKDFAHARGFEVEKSEVRGSWWELINILNLYFSKWILRRDLCFKEAISRRLAKEFAKPGFMSLFIKLKFSNSQY